MDIIERLKDPELYIDAIDDAITEIERLRNDLTSTQTTIRRLARENAALLDELEAEEE